MNSIEETDTTDHHALPVSKTLYNEMPYVQNEIQKVRRHNDSLVLQVNNLLSFISEQNRQKREMQQRININAKTGLPNHNKMKEDLCELFTTLNHDSEPRFLSLILIQLGDNFDTINKTLNSSASEWIVYQISSRIKESLGDEGTLYHTQEDEFLLVFFDGGKEKKLHDFLEDLTFQISKPHIFSGHHINIDCHLGISRFPQNGSSHSQLLNNADIALNYAKRNKKKNVFFKNELHEEAVEKMELQNNIIRALETQSIQNFDHQFFIHLQPIVTVEKLHDKEIKITAIDAEVLARWKHPTLGNITPGTFIPIAEETGLIIVIGKWILYSALEQIKEWNKKPSIQSKLAINVSPRQFGEGDLVDSIKRIIDFQNINPESFQLEITETCFLDDPCAVIQKIKKLKDMGIHIAIDDFGTGFSSVNYLRQLPVDTVKIDRCFITDIVNSHQDKSIVKAMIAMTKELGITHVVEGVENIDQVRTLMEFGINRFQGYYFAKPLDPKAYIKYYKDKLL